jgi:hypothetical protein
MAVEDDCLVAQTGEGVMFAMSFAGSGFVTRIAEKELMNSNRRFVHLMFHGLEIFQLGIRAETPKSCEETDWYQYGLS